VSSSAQPWLPKLKSSVFVVKKNPQPKAVKNVKIRKFEILHHPFDLRFRGRVGKWLEKNISGGQWVVSSEKKELSSTKIPAKQGESARSLSDEELRLLRFYFYPQGKKKHWLNQDEILKKTMIGNKKKLRKLLVESLVKIWFGLKR
jgi:hypothetical protein